MDITQKGDANFVVTSNLTILEVPLNAITKFQFSTHDGKYSKVISFRVRGNKFKQGIKCGCFNFNFKC